LVKVTWYKLLSRSAIAITSPSNAFTNPQDFFQYTSNQTSNHATRMCGPITYWKLQRLYSNDSNGTIIKL
jgi:hypothetical protein